MGPKPDFDEIIVRSLQGRATEAERRALEIWLNASPENQARFEESRRVWLIAERASPAPQPAARRPQATALIRHVRDVAVVGPRRRNRRAPVLANLVPLAAAAGLAALALGFLLFRTAPTGPQVSFGVAEFSTGPRETVTVQLEDGTIVRLGQNSGLRIDGMGGLRNVWLDGQAFFAVARHEAPFIVRTRAGNATVLGTRFDLRVWDDDLRLVVVDGRVRLQAGDGGRHSLEVGPNEMSRVIDGDRVYVSQVPDVYALLDWLEGSLIFQSTPLSRVVEELERHYDTPVVIVDPTVASRTVTAWFTDEPLDAAVTVICRAADLLCEISETGVRMGRRARD